MSSEPIAIEDLPIANVSFPNEVAWSTAFEPEPTASPCPPAFVEDLSKVFNGNTSESIPIAVLFIVCVLAFFPIAIDPASPFAWVLSDVITLAL